MNLKYIIIQDSFGVEVAILMDPLLNHCDAAVSPVIAAGFCDLQLDGGSLVVRCHGKSFTCCVDSRGEQDAELVRSL